MSISDISLVGDINVISLVNDINAMINRENPSTSDTCCIYKVPSDIRTLNENAYTPKFVTIGPFHHRHSHPQIQNMERLKLNYVKYFLRRTGASLNDLVCYIVSILSEFKQCYSESLQISQNELVKLILIDSGFIIEHFIRYVCGFCPFKPWLDVGITLDLLLLENQLPFFVIEKIYTLSLSSTNGVPDTTIPSFLELTVKHFHYFNKSNLSISYLKDIRIRHFTDLIRIFHFQNPQSRRLSSRKIDIVMDESMLHLPSATELFETGVKFKVNTKSECLLDLRFSGRVLEIPQLKVEDGTETLFLNIIALEQCHYPNQSYISDYVAVLVFLVKTGADADILVQSKILQNFLGDSDSVANLFKGLCKNIRHENLSSEFSNLCIELNTFCRNPLHKLKLKATLMRDYCNTPWQAAASIAGILLLVLTIIQTVCSVLQVIPAS